jgi:hypothetical protein
VANLVRKQSGQSTLSGTSVQATVSTYTLANSLLVYKYRGGFSSPSAAQISGRKLNTTTLEFTRNQSSGDSPVIEWELMEFDTDVTVQDLSSSYSSGATHNITVSSVTTGQSFLVPGGVEGKSGSSLSQDDFARWRLTSSTNVERLLSEAYDGTFYAQLVDYADCSVQRFTRDNQTGTSWSQTISSVTTAKSALFGTCAIDAAAGMDDLYRIAFASSTSVQGTSNAGGTSSDIAFEVVSFTDDTTTQGTTRSVASGTATDNVTITTVNTDYSSCQLEGVSLQGQSHGYSDDTDDDFRTTFFSSLLTSSTNLQLQRTDATGQTAYVSWRVISWQYAGEELQNAPFFGCNT